MNKIDISNWKEFKISEVFITNCIGKKLKVPTGSSVDKKNLINGEIPRITVTGINNGIFGYYQVNKDDSNYRVYENFISVSFLGTVFYQSGKASLDMKVHCLKPLTIALNKYTGLFLVNAIYAGLRNSSYSDQISSSVLPNLLIKLPVDNKGKPDWEYMETYMKKVEKLTSTKINNLNSIINIESQKIDISKWKKFNLYDEDLFYIDMGTKLDKVKMTENNTTINFVGRANANNGITACIDLIDNIKPYKAGCMTVSLGGEYLGSCFIQPKDFYTSQNVIVLIPKHEMSLNVKQFISTMIFKESRSHYKAFIDELNRHIKTDFSFYLPVNEDNKPDWQFMDDYMEKIKNKSKNILKTINELP